MSNENILNALKTVKYPGYSRDIVSFGLVKEAVLQAGVAKVVLQLSSVKPEAAQQIKTECEEALRQVAGVQTVQVDVPATAGAGTAPGAPNPWDNQNRVPGIKRIIAVASGKGGVGKSTVSVNLACALTHLGERVGLLDCDIYGPSIPLMMGINDRPLVTPEEKLVPPSKHGIKLMSMGFLVDDGQPLIWRGPMIVKTIQQFLTAVDWGELDYLIVDLPPGTGDAQLTLCQTVPLDGGVVVTTPQEASLGVFRRGVSMFGRLSVPVLGIVENMSYFVTPTGERVEIFGHGGGKAEAERQQLDFLGEVPLYTEIRAGGDKGIPVVVSAPTEAPAKAFLQIAEKVRQKSTAAS